MKQGALIGSLGPSRTQLCQEVLTDLTPCLMFHGRNDFGPAIWRHPIMTDCYVLYRTDARVGQARAN